MTSKLRLVFTFCLLFLVFSLKAQQTYWLPITAQENRKGTSQLFKPSEILFNLNFTTFKTALTQASKTGGVMTFPNAKGDLETYHIIELATFSPQLAAQYPQIKSYVATSVINEAAHLYFSISPTSLSFTGITNTSKSTPYIIEEEKGDLYKWQRVKDFAVEKAFTCTTDITAPSAFNTNLISTLKNNIALKTAPFSRKTTIKTYRLAVAATAAYTEYHGGTVAGALTAINATLTRLNALFGKDLGLQLQLVAETTNVIYTSPESDPFGTDLNSEVQEVLTLNVGEENYDIGHLFHKDTNGGNAGFVGSVCQDGKKGAAFSAALFPEGYGFDIDFVAHEMGHQFGAYHTWSYESEGTGSQVEPGGGTTIMSYAGIVAGENVAASASDYFHAVSILEIENYLNEFSCQTNEVTGNEAPVIAPLKTYKLPLKTPFVLNGIALDSDSQNLTYAWEQGDNGVVPASVFGPQNPTGASFRSLEPKEVSERFFPSLVNVLSNRLSSNLPEQTDWETLSEIPRNYTFYLTVRDNEAVGAGVAIAKTSLEVLPRVGPFLINTPSESQDFKAGDIFPISWEVARTNGPELNTQKLSAYLTTDAGLSFTKKIAAGIDNNGRATLRLPNLNLAQSRIMLKAENNPFFAINTADFSISALPFSLFYSQVEPSVCLGEQITLAAQIEYEAVPEQPAVISFSNLPAGLSVGVNSETISGTTQPLSINFLAGANMTPDRYSIGVLLTSETQTYSTSIALDIKELFLEAPILELPTDGASEVFTDQVLEWTKVAGAQSYEAQISLNDDFTSLVYSNTSLINKIYINDLEANQIYYWRIRSLSDCALSDFSATNSFSTAAINCQTKTSSPLPIVIDSNNPNTVQATLFFAEDLPIESLEVGLDISHSYLSDLVVKLYAPSGAVAVLLANSCDAAKDVQATFSQTAPAFICSDDPAVNGFVKPLGSFEVFRGERLKGTWRLEVQDVAEIDGGSINNFSMKVCVAGNFRPDADQDGVYDDGDDECLSTPFGAEVDTKGCAVYRFNDRNFKISLQSQSCVNVPDGRIEVAAQEAMNYSVEIKNSAGVIVSKGDFLSVFKSNPLVAGFYSVCIFGTSTNFTYESQCFQVQIEAPEPLSVFSSVGFSNGSLHLNLSGSDTYFVALNEHVTTISDKTLNLSLKEGINTLKVTTGLDCQGVYEEQIYYTPKPSIFPNPVKEYVYVQTPSFVNPQLAIQIHLLSGALVSEIKTTASQNPLQINTASWQPGVYVISIRLDGQTYSYKALKE